MPVHDGDAFSYCDCMMKFVAMLASGYQNSGVVQYDLPLKMKESFDLYSNWQLICPLHLTKMEHQQGLCKLSARNRKTLEAQLQKARH